MEDRRIEKLLVANRGEIARRIFASCRRLGIATVAVHSDPDADAPFVADADEAVALGGTTAGDSYLRIDAIVAAAERVGADAIHPGYGFLAENAELARAVEAAGMIWVGPPPGAIEAMGSKIRARALMAEAGVPTLPGAELDRGADSLAAAEAIGYPLLVKASAGGGGKGMRAVAEPSALEAAVDGARREAESAFGDGTVFLERLLERPRHVEIQVIADARGATVSLGERECSIQRRHQKVVEEAPSPAVDPELRERMGAAAVAAAEAVGYVGAGTVEFLLSGEGEFFFLEMNTRLQVEHPVTEMVSGLDLVRLQLLVAGGERLPGEALAVEPVGHAIEVRLYAEDPAADFLPQTGTVDRFAFPDRRAGEQLTRFAVAAPRANGAALVRLDSGVEARSVVSPYYDPMLAKVIAWAPSRREAAARLAAALAAAEVDGIVTNRDFLVRVLRHPAFLAGETDTGFLERHDRLADPLLDESGLRLHAAAAALAAIEAGAGPLGFAPPGWRNNPSAPQRRGFAAGDRELFVEYEFERDRLRVTVDGEQLEQAAIGLADGELEGAGRIVELSVEGVRRAYSVARSGDGESLHVSSPLGSCTLRELPRYPSGEKGAAEGALVAPMPGKVIKLAAAEGDPIRGGEVVVVLEAMKMEHELTAPADGTLRELRVAEGDQVESGAVLGLLDAGTPGE